MKSPATALAIVLSGLTLSMPAHADPFTFNNGTVNTQIAVASRPGTGTFEIEAADDFILANRTFLSGAGFVGLLPAGASITEVVVEIYRVFPKDSLNPPSGHVPTRVNSPSDVAFDSRDSADASLSFSSSTLATGFSALNSVLPGGIHPLPGSTTGGNGPVQGNEVAFSVSFATPFDLSPDHYFFVPQVAISGANGSFLWLSSVRPIVAPGTPFTPDLQAWTRDQFLDPDWLRVGTDIVGGATPPTFNLAFSLVGETVAAVPEPETWALLALGLPALAAWRRRRVSRPTD
jgi:hypothetical protein